MSDAPPLFDAAFAAQFDALLHWRRDVRHFRGDPVPRAEMDALFDAAACAPSVGNAQPWRFVQVEDAALRQALAAHVDAQILLAGARHDGTARHADYLALKLHGIDHAPDIVAVFCDEAPVAGHGLGVATMPEMLHYSVVMAVHTLWLAARVRGIGVGWVSILDPVAVTAMLDVPPDWSLIALLCIGYPAQESAVPELERRGWQDRQNWRDHRVVR